MYWSSWKHLACESSSENSPEILFESSCDIFIKSNVTWGSLQLKFPLDTLFSASMSVSIPLSLTSHAWLLFSALEELISSRWRRLILTISQLLDGGKKLFDMGEHSFVHIHFVVYQEKPFALLIGLCFFSSLCEQARTVDNCWREGKLLRSPMHIKATRNWIK